jgi:hypothetical protein
VFDDLVGGALAPAPAPSKPAANFVADTFQLRARVQSVGLA